MPALFALAQHDALAAADEALLPSEIVLSFLDDLYIVTSRARAREAFREVASRVEEMAGIQSNLGKLRAWSAGGGPAPTDLAELGAEIWTADLPPEDNGIKILGTPLGTTGYVQKFASARTATENVCWRSLHASGTCTAPGAC